MHRNGRLHTLSLYYSIHPVRAVRSILAALTSHDPKRLAPAPRDEREAHREVPCDPDVGFLRLVHQEPGLLLPEEQRGCDSAAAADGTNAR